MGRVNKNLLISEILIPSLNKLYEMDFFNILMGVSERNICARLAHHLENTMRDYDREHESSLFHGYYVDVEYNRMGLGDLKHVMNSQNRSQYVVSDLLIQRRGYGGNLLAAELKRKGNSKNVKGDKERLMSLVSSSIGREDDGCVHDTLLGTFIEYSPGCVRVELYEAVNGRGEKTGILTSRFGEEHLSFISSPLDSMGE